MRVLLFTVMSLIFVICLNIANTKISCLKYLMMREYLRIRRMGLITTMDMKATTMDMKAALTQKESLEEVVKNGWKDATLNVIVAKMESHYVSVMILSVSMGIVKDIKWIKIIKSIIS